MTTAGCLAGFLLKLPSEKLNWILRQVRLRSGVRPPQYCWPCARTKPFPPETHIPLRTLLMTNLGEVWIQKTQMEIILWCKRLNEWLILLWQLVWFADPSLAVIRLFILPIDDLPTPIRHFLCYQSQGFYQHFTSFSFCLSFLSS